MRNVRRRKIHLTSLCAVGATTGYARGLRRPRCPYHFVAGCFCASPESHRAQFRRSGLPQEPTGH